jgi:hypothetical protein
VKPGQCATPEPGESLDDRLERMQADGQITVHDADEVRTFAAFLRDVGPPPTRAKPMDAEQAERVRKALWEHYPDQYPELNPDERTDDASTDV